MDRRRMFAFLAAAPAAANEIAQQAAAQAVGMLSGPTSSGGTPPMGIVQVGAASAYDRAQETLSDLLLKGVGHLPDWRREEIEYYASRRAFALDPDISVLVSVSGVHKRRMQVRREVQRSIDEARIGIMTNRGWRKYLAGF